MGQSIADLALGLEQLRCEAALRLLVELGKGHLPVTERELDAAKSHLVDVAVDLASRLATQIGLTREAFERRVQVEMAAERTRFGVPAPEMRGATPEGRRTACDCVKPEESCAACDRVVAISESQADPLGRTGRAGWLGAISGIIAKAFGELASQLDAQAWETMLVEIGAATQRPKKTSGLDGLGIRAHVLGEIESIIAAAFRDRDVANRVSAVAWDEMIGAIEQVINAEQDRARARRGVVG